MKNTGTEKTVYPVSPNAEFSIRKAGKRNSAAKKIIVCRSSEDPYLQIYHFSKTKYHLLTNPDIPLQHSIFKIHYSKFKQPILNIEY